MSFVQMTLSGGVFILFIVVVRALALHHLPKGAFLVLWEMAALRMLLPFTIPLPFRVLVPMGRLSTAGEYLAAGGVPALEPSDLVLPGTPAPTDTAFGAVLPIIWLIGMILMTAYFGVFYIRTRRRFRVSAPDDTPAVRRWLAGHGLRRPLEVRQSAQVSSPLTYGILRPVILLPAGMERDDETALTCILTHEFIHVRRFDGVTKLMFAAVLCVHWFNPLAWVLYVLANRDLELSCDKRVMDALGGQERASYALTLLNMAETQSQCASLYNHFGKLAIEERIEAIMKYKKTSILAIAFAAALVFGATTAFAASTAGPVDQSDDFSAPSDRVLVAGGQPMATAQPREDEDNNLPDHTDFEQAGRTDLSTPVDVLPTESSANYDDENTLTPEEWAELLTLIEQGKAELVGPVTVSGGD